MRTDGLDPQLARAVAEQLTTHDALGAQVRDEIGLPTISPRVSGDSLIPVRSQCPGSPGGRASTIVGATRVAVGGVVAVAVTAGIGALFGAVL